MLLLVAVELADRAALVVLIRTALVAAALALIEAAQLQYLVHKH